MSESNDHDLQALLGYSTTYQDTDGRFKPTGGTHIELCRLILPKGGLIEFSQPLNSVFPFFLPAEGRDVFAWNDRKDVGNRDKAWNPYMMKAPDRFPWGWGQGFTPPIVAMEFVGPAMIEDVVYKDAI